jgi:hypothetical protein
MQLIEIGGENREVVSITCNMTELEVIDMDAGGSRLAQGEAQEFTLNPEYAATAPEDCALFSEPVEREVGHFIVCQTCEHADISYEFEEVPVAINRRTQILYPRNPPVQKSWGSTPRGRRS